MKQVTTQTKNKQIKIKYTNGFFKPLESVDLEEGQVFNLAINQEIMPDENRIRPELIDKVNKSEESYKLGKGKKFSSRGDMKNYLDI